MMDDEIDARIAELEAQIRAVEAERDRQYDENVNRIHQQALAENALAAERARVAKLVEAARDAEYDLLQWLECGEHLTKAGFNMDGTPEVVRNLTAALREFQEKSNAEV